MDACHGRLSRFYQKFLTNILLPPAYPNFPFLFLNITFDTAEFTFNFQILENVLLFRDMPGVVQ